MPKTVYSTYTSDEIDVEFVASFGKYDDIPPEIEILSLHVLGVKVVFHTLPKALQSAILNLHHDATES